MMLFQQVLVSSLEASWGRGGGLWLYEPRNSFMSHTWSQCDPPHAPHQGSGLFSHATAVFILVVSTFTRTHTRHDYTLSYCLTQFFPLVEDLNPYKSVHLPPNTSNTVGAKVPPHTHTRVVP